MPKTLVTGATGFIGSHVARALVERGDDVRVTARATSRLDAIEDLECERVVADVTDRRSMRRALVGVERVFHVAGTTSLRAAPEALFATNVDGTRVVLEECLRAGVQRVVHTSSVAAIGPAEPGSTADERQVFRGDGLDVPYAHAKHEAEAEALRIGAQGLPLVIVNPAHVFGGGDHLRSSTDVVRRFLLRRIPGYTDGAINVVDVRDVAAGHLLADERGRLGERYILANRNYTWERLFADLGRFSGIEPPAVKLPVAVALALAEAAARMPGRAPVTPAEIRAASQWWTYRNTKARRELGFAPRSHEDTVEATVAWWRERLGPRVAPGARQPVPLRLAGVAARALGELGSRFAR